MSLVASVLEPLGIVTVALSVLPSIMAALRPPRVLEVPFGLGMPVGPAGDAGTQSRVVRAALALTADRETPLTARFSDES